MISKSLGTTVSGKTSRASRAISGPEVPVGEVRQGEHLHARGRGEPRRAGGGGVRGLVGALALLLGEGGLVDEDVCVLRDLEDARRRRRVAGEDDPPPGPRRPEDLLGAHLAAVRKLDRLAGLETAEERPVRHSQRLGPSRRRSGPAAEARTNA